MNDDDIKKLGQELAQGIKTQADCEQVVGKLFKSFYETVLGAELDAHLAYAKHHKATSHLPVVYQAPHHLAYAKHHKATSRRSNTRNGYGTKTLKTDKGPIEIEVPRDRNASFEPVIISKGVTCVEGFDETILSLYARGMTTRDIQDTLKDLYRGATVSSSTIARVTDAVNEEVTAWNNRPLDALYPIVYFDGLSIKVHTDGQVINKTIYLSQAVNKDGYKELLGLWIAEHESGLSSGFPFSLNCRTEVSKTSSLHVWTVSLVVLKLWQLPFLRPSCSCASSTK